MKILLIAAAALMLALPAHATSGVSAYPDAGVTGAEVAADLMAIEQIVTLGKDSTGDPMIDAAFKVGDSKVDYRIFFFGCKDERCASIQYHVAFNGNAAKVDSWNAEHRFARAYAKDKVIHLEYDVDLEEGANSTSIQNSARRFIAVLIDGVTYFD